MRKNLFLFISLFLLLSYFSYAQQYTIQGKVVDKITEEPLAFVNVVYGEPPRGTSTNIDGEFTLKLQKIPDHIEISYLGYYSKIVTPGHWQGKKKLVVPLEPKSFDLEEVVIRPGYNPANRIIQKVVANKDRNNPENLGSFSYKSYNKMVFTLDTNELVMDEKPREDTAKADSAIIRMRKFMDEQHLFLMESISKRKYLSPDKNKEQVLASRVSGFKNPSLVFLATQFQSFSFYNDFIALGDYNYLNPVTKNSTNKYIFNLQDTLYTTSNDSIYVISFRPEKGKNFDGLKGILHIHTHGYALQKVIAEPADPRADFSIKIQQQYELVEGEQWFPSQLNTRIKFNNVMATTGNTSFHVVGDGRTYIQEVKINPEIDPASFSRVEVEVPDSAYKQSEDYWSSHRAMVLSRKDRRTYEMIDSLGKAHRFDQKLKTFQVLTTGYFPVGFLNVDYTKFLSYNQHEGIRLGMGGMTNDQISPWFAVGGYFAYGFKDKKWKYGGNVAIDLHETSESQLEFLYYNDVKETGSYSFLRDLSFLSSEYFRKYMVEKMDRIEKKEVSFTFRTMQYLKARIFVNQYSVDPLDNYRFTNDNTVYSDHFDFTETGMQLKFAYKEKFIETPWGLISQGTNYPVIFTNVTRAHEMLEGDFSNLKLEARVSKIFTTRMLGKTHLTVIGGSATGELPVYSLYNGNGSFASKWSLQVDNTFSTMGLNEFYAQRFVHVFLKQNFGSLLYKSGNFSPRLSLVGNMGWGWLENTADHQNINLQSFSEGYFETGLLLDNLLSVNFFSYGFGIYYRLGSYAFDHYADNFAYKFSLRFNL
jgi:hypothetical protein